MRPVTPDGGPRHGTDPQTEAANAAAHLAGWLPVSAQGLDPETVAKVEPEARAAAAAAQPGTVSDVHRMLRASFGISTWALDELGFLDPATVWHPTTVRAWVDEVCADQSVDWRQEAGRTLTQIGRAVNPQYWAEQVAPLTKTGPAAAYDATEEAALRHAALLRGEPGSVSELAVAGLSLGAGLRGPQIAAAGPGDIIEMGAGRVAVRARGPHSRSVPVRADYTPLVLRAREYAAGERFVTAQSRNAVYSAAERVMVHGFGHLELARARSTWLTAHLVAGTPLAALRVIAGPLSLNTLTSLLNASADAISAEEAAVEGLRA